MERSGIAAQVERLISVRRLAEVLLETVCQATGRLLADSSPEQVQASPEVFKHVKTYLIRLWSSPNK